MSEVKEPIAQRVLQSEGARIVVTFDKPEEIEGDYVCRYSIEGPTISKTSHAMGADGVQALQLAMKKVGADVSFMESKGGVVTWLDMPGGNSFLNA